MARTVEEWVGKTDDAKIPRAVRQRVFDRFNGVCYLSKRAITPADDWDVEHKLALCLGGEHRESNMAPALTAPHREKTAIDRGLKAKNDRIRKRHLGIKKPRTMTRWRKMNGDPVFAARER